MTAAPRRAPVMGIVDRRARWSDVTSTWKEKSSCTDT
jgi:hypothetical protein